MYPPVMRASALAAIFLSAALGLAAGPAHIEGRWITFDEETKSRRAIVQIVRQEGKLTGRIVEYFPRADEYPDPVCDLCAGADRGRKIRGLQILALEAEAGGNGQRFRGTVLDPEEGKVYRCVATLLANGRRLSLRGYVGLEFLGRSETWERAH